MHAYIHLYLKLTQNDGEREGKSLKGKEAGKGEQVFEIKIARLYLDQKLRSLEKQLQ